MEDRKQIIEKLIQGGRTYEEVGNLLGVSRQRIHQIYRGYSSSPKNNSTTIPIDWLPNKVFDKKINYKNFRGRDFLREIIRKRDKYSCQICGKLWAEEERRLDVHHIDEEKEGINGRLYKNNKDFSKMITLCHKCHLNLDHLRRKMSAIGRII